MKMLGRNVHVEKVAYNRKAKKVGSAQSVENTG